MQLISYSSSFRRQEVRETLATRPMLGMTVPFFGGGVSLGDLRWHFSVGLWYVPIGCQYIQTTLHLASCGRNLWCKFWLGVVSPSLAEGAVVGDWR